MSASSWYRLVGAEHQDCTCRHCGAAFKARRFDQVFCSTRCRWTYRNRHVGTNHGHRARRLGVPVERLKHREIFEADGWRCYLCAVETPPELQGTYAPNAPTIDHVVPLTLGGGHTRDNVRCACRSCNGRKGNRLEIPGKTGRKRAIAGTPKMGRGVATGLTSRIRNRR
jgi:5-methylcytosine-specific restriction endonuclease McrA